MADLMSQLSEQRHKVDFNTYDMTVKELINMVNSREINIAPDYQRQFRWEADRQSTLVESIFLGIPVPSLFMATNSDNTWEVIDGVQRLSTIVNYVAEKDSLARNCIGHSDPLRLEGLKKLTDFNGKLFTELPTALQLDFKLKPLKIITLSDKSDKEVRFDLFERLNTGGVKLSDQEIRSCVYRGPFNELIKRLSLNEDFLYITHKPENASIDGTMEELVLRFFAYLYYRQQFKHGVKEFLNEYMGGSDENRNFAEMENIFKRVCGILRQLPYGIVKLSRKNTTSTILWEAITVGLAEALMAGKNEFQLDDFYVWTQNSDFVKLITGATNSAIRVENRIQYAKNMFMR